MSDENKSTEWLIKSSGEIKGPYTFDQVVEGLYSKEFIVVDEIAKKFSRWKYIRDEDAFHSIINEMKNRDEFKTDKTFTNSTTDVLTEDLSDKIINFKGKDNLISSVKKELKYSEEKKAAVLEEEAISQQKEKSREKVKKFVSEKELKKKTKRNFIVQTALIVAILALGAIYYLQSKKETSLSLDDLKKQAYAKINYGNFEKAKYYLKKAVTLDNNDQDLKYLLAYSEIATDDSMGAVKDLNDLKISATKPLIQAQAYNLHGILQLKNFSLDKAKVDFAKSLEIDPKYIQAVYNRGVTSYLENDFNKSQEDFATVIDQGSTEGAVFLAMTEVLTRNNKENLKDDATKKKIGELSVRIQKIISSQQIYRQELLIASAYLNFYLQKTDDMSKMVAKSLTIDPQLTSDHLPDVSYYRVITWDQIAEWVLTMRDANPTNSDLKTLYGYAEFRGSEKLKGKDILEGLLQSDYNNVANQILHAYTLWNLNQDADAKAALQPILTNQDEPLTFYLLGQICLKQKDFNCALLNFDKVLQVRGRDLGALAGMAEAYLQQKNYGKVQETLSKGLAISTTYRPILAVKEQFEERTE